MLRGVLPALFSMTYMNNTPLCIIYLHVVESRVDK